MYKKFIIFDLDGVLINSIKNMEISWNKVRDTYNLTQKFQTYFEHIGKPFNEILNDIGIKKNQNEIKKLYKNHSIKHFKKIKIYPGVLNTIKYFKKKKIQIAIVTSKDKHRTKKLIDHFKLNIKLAVSPSKKLKGKPNPDTILYAIKKAKIKRKDCIYIGDTATDFLAAKNAKIDFVFVNYGYFNDKIKCKYKINKFQELKKIINVK